MSSEAYDLVFHFLLPSTKQTFFSQSKGYCKTFITIRILHGMTNVWLSNCIAEDHQHLWPTITDKIIYFYLFGNLITLMLHLDCLWFNVVNLLTCTTRKTNICYKAKINRANRHHCQIYQRIERALEWYTKLLSTRMVLESSNVPSILTRSENHLPFHKTHGAWCTREKSSLILTYIIWYRVCTKAPFPGQHSRGHFFFFSIKSQGHF